MIRCKDEGLAVEADDLHTELYRELKRLDGENRNGVWARIIKNAFAPLFIGRFDFVVGNPPWINWESLPDEYRDTLKPLTEYFVDLKPKEEWRPAFHQNKEEVIAAMNRD